MCVLWNKLGAILFAEVSFIQEDDQIDVVLRLPMFTIVDALKSS
jgi:hypothetical protein